MALFKYLKRREPENEAPEGLPAMSTCGASLTKAQLREANNAVLEIVKVKNTTKRGKYNRYTPKQSARIGKYAAENGPSSASTHYSALLDVKVRL